MRTKTLILSALCGLMGSAAAMAQVYSVNAVGYVNKVFPANQYVIFANPLDTTNTLANLFSGLTAPDTGSTIYKWNLAAGSYDMATFDTTMNGWFNSLDGSDANSWTLDPGEGAWFISNRTMTNTFVGNVRTGNLTHSMPKGQYVMIASQVPQAGDANVLNLSAGCGEGDTLYKWTGSDYLMYQFTGGAWINALDGTSAIPTLDVAEGAFFFSDPGHEGSTFNRTFNVNN